ncbi:MAG: subclass B3 metallo-beta-lactamase [Gemmatimonadaceae bacterium]
MPSLSRCLLAAALAAPAVVSAQATVPISNVRDTTRFAPFRMIGNVFYVGSQGIASFLVTTPSGHILVDTGFRPTAEQVLQNIATLGFKPADVKIMLSTHAHFDHVAGHALVKATTGAKVYASAEDALLLESGGAKDFRFGSEITFEPVKVDHILRDGEAVTLGGTTLVAHITPGHTKGNTAWTMKVSEGGKTYDAIVAPSMSINPGVKLVNYAPYPEIARDYQRSFEFLDTLKPDVFLGPHAGFFDMDAKAKQQRDGATTNPFIDPVGFKRYVAGYRKSFEAQLKAEGGCQGGGKPGCQALIP